MFVKMYRYELRASDFHHWKHIIDAADRIYHRYGGGNTKRLLQKGEQYHTIIELDYYPSKQEYLTTLRLVTNDSEITSLFQAFLKTLRDQRYIEEEFETI